MSLDVLYNLISDILPFTWLEPTFIKRALLAILIISPICAAMGVLMINFRMTFFSDAVSHSAFTGVALGLISDVSPYLTMILFGIFVGIAITMAKRNTELSVDAVIGVFFSASVALGFAVISAMKGLTQNFHSFIYGDILAISDTEILWFIGLLAVIVGFSIYAYNKLILMGISERIAGVEGVSVLGYDYAFAILLALTITFSIRAIGILLVTAMLIVPAVAGRNIAKSVIGMFWYPVIISIVSGIAGLMTSYYIDTATGATIILFAVACFIITQIAKVVMDKLA